MAGVLEDGIRTDRKRAHNPQHADLYEYGQHTIHTPKTSLMEETSANPTEAEIYNAMGTGAHELTTMFQDAASGAATFVMSPEQMAAQEKFEKKMLAAAAILNKAVKLNKVKQRGQAYASMLDPAVREAVANKKMFVDRSDVVDPDDPKNILAKVIGTINNAVDVQNNLINSEYTDVAKNA